MKDSNLNKSVVNSNPLPLVFGGADPYDLPTDKQGCLYLVIIMLIMVAIIIIGCYVAVSK